MMMLTTVISMIALLEVMFYVNGIIVVMMALVMICSGMVKVRMV
jgi:hypothetical protein